MNRKEQNTRQRQADRRRRQAERHALQTEHTRWASTTRPARKGA